jgi:calcineurin-like phosphoesterase family protein
MSKIWFTADTHFKHTNVIRYCNRPFKKGTCCDVKECQDCKGYGFIPNTEEMDRVLIENWNNLVDPQDTVYHLGDVMFTGKKQDVVNIFSRLNGHIHWIYGNHDSKLRNAGGCTWAGDYKEIKAQKHKFILCHYPLMSWNGQSRGSIMLHGHCHGNLRHDNTKLLIDVGVDSWSYKPVSVEQIIEKVNKIKENNYKKHKTEILTDDHH